MERAKEEPGEEGINYLVGLRVVHTTPSPSSLSRLYAWQIFNRPMPITKSMSSHDLTHGRREGVPAYTSLCVHLSKMKDCDTWRFPTAPGAPA